MTLFQTIDWLITEASNRIGEPSPLFFRTLRKAFAWLTSLSGLILVLQGIKLIHLPDWVVTTNIVFTAICASGWAQTHLPVRDREELPENPRPDGKVDPK
jgi:hypothetical protein